MPKLTSDNPTMEELLASQSKKLITLYRGQPVEGEIVAKNEKEVILDLGAKSEGVLPIRDLSDSEQKELKAGDKIKAYVIMTENESGQVVLSSSQLKSRTTPSFKGRGIHWAKFLSRREIVQRFISAQNQKSKLKGIVLEVNKGGLIIEVEGTRGFLPNSQVGFELLSKSGQGMENLIGQSLTVTVIEVDSENNKLIFSQRGQVSDEVKLKLSEFKNNQKVTGKIVAVLPFGLVVDVSGVEGLVFIADVSWEREEDLSKTYTPGDQIEVLVIGLDEDLGRLNLSIKQLTQDPILKLADIYQADDVVKGEITEVSKEGVLVKLDKAEGFLPASKMNADTNYEVGKSITVLVDSVDRKKRRINLAPFVTSTEGLIYK